MNQAQTQALVQLTAGWWAFRIGRAWICARADNDNASGTRVNSGSPASPEQRPPAMTRRSSPDGVKNASPRSIGLSVGSAMTGTMGASMWARGTGVKGGGR